eukprot:5430282-Amphidinium_carterae.1
MFVPMVHKREKVHAIGCLLPRGGPRLLGGLSRLSRLWLRSADPSETVPTLKVVSKLRKIDQQKVSS